MHYTFLGLHIAYVPLMKSVPSFFFLRDACIMVVVFPEPSTLHFAYSVETRIPFMFIESHLAQ